MKKFLKNTSRAGSLSLTVLLALAILLGAYNYIIPDSVCCMSGEALPEFAGAIADPNMAVSVSSSADTSTTYQTDYLLFGVLPVKTVSVNVESRTKLYVGGMPFGVKFSTDGVMVVGYGSELPKNMNPAYVSGIRPADVITGINGHAIHDVNALCKAIEQSAGKTLTVSCRRSGKEFTVKLTPYLSKTDNKYKSGMLVRDSGAGIGTVTYIEPESCLFGGLGHGICDGETGAIIPMERGVVTDVAVNGVVKGVCGTPGELRGSFKQKKLGSLLKNSSCGVFGILSELPGTHGELLPIALSSEVKCGDAYIYCTLDDTGPQRYSIKISDIDRSASGNKCFTVKVCDPALLEKTGGIVQGMSGSPIIQNGKLVGAVTHVLINDPATGYGIFIENMLNAAQMPMAKAS